MVWTMVAAAFLGTIAVLAALLYAFTPTEMGIARRLSRLVSPSAPSAASQARFKDRQKDHVRDTFAGIGKLVSGDKAVAPRAQLSMIRAGYRSPEAALAIRGVKLATPLALVAVVFAAGFYRLNPYMFLLLAVIIGYLLPEAWLSWRVRARQHRLRRALPDCLDLLVICVEAGLGLDQALMKVAQEMRVTHPELSEELHLVNLEMRIGKSRLDALRELARRTGLEDIKSLVAMLIQTERFGTSVAQSLRVYSDDLRVKRRQRAEEMSAKTAVKMVPPLVIFIFPALMVVILGPAVITLFRQLLPVLQK
jgi:tight adherence protein C